MFDTSRRFTAADLDSFPMNGKRYEIFDGALSVTPVPPPSHQIVVGNVAVPLWSHLENQTEAQVLLGPLDVILFDDCVVEPDALVIRSDRESIVGPTNIQGAPNLCIEVICEATRRLDEIDKLALYDRGGVDEYWIVDPELELVKIYRRASAGAAFERVEEISTETGGAITTPLLPDFTLDIADVFRT